MFSIFFSIYWILVIKLLSFNIVSKNFILMGEACSWNLQYSQYHRPNNKTICRAFFSPIKTVAPKDPFPAKPKLSAKASHWLHTKYINSHTQKKKQKLFEAMSSSARTKRPTRMVLRRRTQAPNPVDVDDGSESEYDAVCCEECGLGHFASKLLLCDKCDKGYHLFCLRPILVSVPKGSWFCHSCSHLHNKLKCTFKFFGISFLLGLFMWLLFCFSYTIWSDWLLLGYFYSITTWFVKINLWVLCSRCMFSQIWTLIPLI